MISVRRSVRMARWVARSSVGRDVFRLRQIRCPHVMYGNDGAAFTVNPALLNRASVVYSFGIGDDVSFDLGLIRSFSVEVHAFDPTPGSLGWLATQELPLAFHAHAFGVADRDAMVPFFPPCHTAHVSHTMLSRSSGHPAESREAPVYRLETIMKMLGHTRVDLLKLDIEGEEYAVIRDLVKCDIPVGQICVEFHHRWPEVGPGRTREAIRLLNGSGYRIFDVAPTGEEYSFLRPAC